MKSKRQLLSGIFCVLCSCLCLADRGLPANAAPELSLTPEQRAWLQQHPVIRIAADPDYPPFQFTNNRGESAGLANDYLAIIASRLGVRFEYQHTANWAESLQLIREHKADMVAVATETPERREYMRFTTPYVEFPDVVIIRAGEPRVTLKDLSGRQLLTIKGFGINEFLRKNHPRINLKLVPDVETLLTEISTGEADVGVLNLATTSYAIEKWKISNLAVSSSTGFSYKLALASRRDWPMLQQLLQKGIDAISADEKQVIARRWVGLEPLPWRPTQEQFVALAVTLIVIGFGVTLLWNQQLRKTVESRTRELQASEEAFRNLYRTALVGLFRSRIDGTILAANPALAKQFGYISVESFVDEFRSTRAYAEPGVRQQLLRQLSRQGRVDNFEFLGRLRDGSVRHFLLSGTLYKDLGYLEGAILDITDRKRAENAAKDARETAERASKAKTDFLAAASHDLRQPLHAMSLQTGQLQHMLCDPDAQRILAQISNAQFALSDILNTLLDISHLDAGTLKATIAEVPLSALFSRLENEFTPLAGERGLALRFHPRPVWVKTDGALLYRILANLVDNAIKNSRAPGVLVGARRRGVTCSIEVWDCGQGIAEDQQQQIFEEFVQLDNPGRDRRKGLGLGLSIVQRLNHLLGHELSLASRLGRGSCFRVLVPETMPAPDRHGQPLTHEERAYRLHGAVVLVVDDEPDVLAATRELLTRWHCAVLTAATLEQAREVAADEDIDMIIADYHLADGHSGLDVIEVLRRSGHERSKAVIITGNMHAKDLAGCGYPVLTKPVAAVSLRSTLHRLLVS